MDHLTSLTLASLDDLRVARANIHKAAQLVTMVARVNLPAQPDDSHSNFEWRHADQAFFIEKIGQVEVGLGLSSFSLIVRTPQEEKVFALAGNSYAAAGEWLDQTVGGLGLKPGGDIAPPYELPADVAGLEQFMPSESIDSIRCLSEWFDLAAGLFKDFSRNNSSIKPGPGPVRCWPHHLDIATYVSLEEGDAETTKGIGVGFSPGDDTYDQPYFYINPWPHLDRTRLPPAPSPGHWHTDGFVGLIATAQEVLSEQAPETEIANFIDQAFEAGCKQLQA